jgi:hypothetical protein
VPTALGAKQTIDPAGAACLRQGIGEDEGDATEGEGYQLEMMRCLREINADNNMVGW